MLVNDTVNNEYGNEEINIYFYLLLMVSNFKVINLLMSHTVILLLSISTVIKISL